MVAEVVRLLGYTKNARILTNPARKIVHGVAARGLLHRTNSQRGLQAVQPIFRATERRIQRFSARDIRALAPGNKDNELSPGRQRCDAFFFGRLTASRRRRCSPAHAVASGLPLNDGDFSDRRLRKCFTALPNGVPLGQPNRRNVSAKNAT